MMVFCWVSSVQSATISEECTTFIFMVIELIKVDAGWEEANMLDMEDACKPGTYSVSCN